VLRDRLLEKRRLAGRHTRQSIAVALGEERRGEVETYLRRAFGV
jgi:hypothetical protein